MSVTTTPLTADALRAALLAFWSDALQIERTDEGFALALPATLPDGWQVIIHVQGVTPKGVKLTDKGATLRWLAGLGQNVETELIETKSQEICRQHRIQHDGWELFTYLPTPLNPLDLHVYSEGLVAVAHLYHLREATPRTPDIADQTLRRVFSDRHLDVRSNVALPGKTEREVRVDYVVQPSRPVAFQVIRRRGRIMTTLEQWGYRWSDVRKTHPRLLTAMVYDPALQDIDPASLAVGEDICDLFCPHSDTHRIHELLTVAAN